MAALTDRGIPLSALSPKFLHTNSTSHTWPFSAIAELVDNAYDPDVSAKQFWIDKTRIRNTDCLTFLDNGSGLSYDKMHKMLSFGFSDKQTIDGHVPVGLYGNGFKSGSMRLGRDAMVLSKTRDAMCVGMLSQTYLEQTGANHVVVPIVAFRRTGPNQFHSAPEHSASLQDILKYSLFQTESELYAELLAITAHGTMATTGTRVVIWNLRKTTTGQMEFDFNTDRYDIRIPPTVFETNRETYKRPERVMESPPESDFSLRAYTSILYLKPRMQIIIRGQKVKTQLVSKNLAYSRHDGYRPNFHNARVKITFGYNTKSKDHYGMMMYHKNRLIKAYERVGCQLKANIKGVGVIGVIECNFLKPTHNKQDFDYTDEYRKTINSVAIKLEEYWREIRHKRDQEDPNCTIPLEDTFKRPDQNWAQCDKCLQWRKLPDGIDPDRLPDRWFCHLNPDPQFRSCHVPQEQADSDDEASYPKTYKQHERHSRMQLERQRQQMEEARKKEEMERISRLKEQNEQLRRQHARLTQQIRNSTDLPARLAGSVQRSALATAPRSSGGHSQTGSSSEGMPIITSVCSLSTPSRLKRRRTSGLDSAEAKQARASHSPGSEVATASSPAAACPVPTVVIPDDDDEEEEEEDEDIVIDETKSTPKPKAPTFDIARVKTEGRTTEVPGLLLDCTDDAAPDVPEPAAAASSAATPNRSPSTSAEQQQEQVSTTTQTETSAAIKEEKEEVKNTADGREKNRAKEAEAERTDAGTSALAEEKAAKATEDEAASASPMDVAAAEEGPSASPLGNEARGSTEVAGGKGSGEIGEAAVEANEMDPPTDGEGERAAVQPPQDAQTPREKAILIEAQEQQDQLMEMMEKTASERDAFQSEVHQLIVKVEDLEQNLEQLSQKSVKREVTHQECQTDKPESDASDLESLQQQLEQVRKERDALAEEKKRWQEKHRGEGCSSSPKKGQKEEEGAGSSQVNVVDDELALQVDFLLREMDQCNADRDDLKSKLGSLEVEKAALASRMEQLQKELEEMRRDGSRDPAGGAQGQSSAEARGDAASGSSPSRQVQANDSSERRRQNGTEDGGGMEVETQGERKVQGDSQTHGSSDRLSKEEKQRLSELRRSVGRLLVTFVPALDLNQVNYECSVIDEILDQVLQEISQSENGIDAT
ncbi:MORC family CW-type zinc finger protein 3a isoform X2 [Sardina pilchardus]|uniref:MORC family CW-type zinc finger protein 3a isoform X2 n=1 Tax=Sardina pilchardus TaxID=27697 RepID=UPI002E151558